MRSVLVIGATGLVGAECVRRLLNDPSCSRVVVVARSEQPVMLHNPKLEWHVADFDTLALHSGLFRVNHIICAIGTTRSKSPSRDIYRKIDYEYPLLAARLGFEHGATHYLIVTAMSANPRSRIHYSRLKGEVERDLKKLGYRSITIVRPSFLVGDRREPRLSERAVWRLGFLMPRKYKPVSAAAVARTLVDASRADREGIHVLENDDILAFEESSG